jgi:Xanthosine triphosphate pyrophosphatase
LIKAKALMNIAHCATLADDSGLCVDALGGRPGVYSARYSGVHGDDDANNRLLLKELENVPQPRTAHYGAAIALCRPGHAPITVYGRCEGEILNEYRGEGGFGYDPLFFSKDLGVTFAQADPEAKIRSRTERRPFASLLKCWRQKNEAHRRDLGFP